MLNQNLLDQNSSDNRRKRKKKPIKNKSSHFYHLLTRVSAQKVLYSLVILACIFRAFDFHSMKKNLSNPKRVLKIQSKLRQNLESWNFENGDNQNNLWNSLTNVTLADLNTVSQDFRHAQPHFLVSLFYIFIIISLVLVICYWSECFFVPDFSQSIEKKTCQGVFLYKSSVAFVCFTSVLGFSTIGQFLVSSAAKLIKQDENLSSFINIIFLLCIAVLMFAVHVAFLTIGVEIYFKLNGAFCFKQHKENARNNPGIGNSDATAIATAKLLEPFRKQIDTCSPTNDPGLRTNYSANLDMDYSANSNNNSNKNEKINNVKKLKNLSSNPSLAGPGRTASGTLNETISSTRIDSNNNRITQNHTKINTTNFSSNLSEKHFNNSMNSIQSSCTTESASCYMPNFHRFNKNNNNNEEVADDNSFFPAIGTKKSEAICARIGLILQGLQNVKKWCRGVIFKYFYENDKQIFHKVF